MHMRRARAVCDHLALGGRHHEWGCTAAQAVVPELRRVLAGCAGGPPRSDDSLWLACRSSQQLDWGAWVILFQRALLIIDKGQEAHGSRQFRQHQ